MLHRRRWPILIALILGGYLALLGLGVWVYRSIAAGDSPTLAAPAVMVITATPIAAPTLTIGVAPPSATAGPPTPTPTPARPDSYTVVEGDTLWSIATQFNLSLDALAAANPSLNPDLLSPGDVVRLAGPVVETLTPAPTALPANARVAAGGGGLRLRTGPGLSQNILTLLDALTPLTLIGRTDTGDWVQVMIPGGISGWVVARWVETSLVVESLPVTGQTLAMPTGQPANGVALPTPPGEAGAYPYISNLHEHTRQLFQFGLSLGNYADVFSKVGDSITVSDSFLKPVGWGAYNLREYANLRPVIDYYSQSTARDANSFANTSLAAKVGWPVQALLSPKAADPNYCWPGEAPLVCEYRWVKPAVALIMLGTNDVVNTPADLYERRLREVIGISQELGVVPVISTLPEMHRAGIDGRVALLNGIITRLALEYDIPLWDYHAALAGLPNEGIFQDGVHPSVGPASADFTVDNLQYGYTVRNLTALQALDAVWRFVAR